MQKVSNGEYDKLVAKQVLDNNEPPSIDRAANAYALAVIAQRSGDRQEAIEWASQCLEIISKVNTNSMESCAHGGVILGVPVPDFLHEKSVKKGLRGYRITI